MLKARALAPRTAAAILAVVVVFGGVVGVGKALFSSGEERTDVLKDAVTCTETLLRDRDVICLASPSILSELAPDEREARILKVRKLADAAGMNRVVFEDRGRIWRTLVLRAPGLPEGSAVDGFPTKKPPPPTPPTAPGTLTEANGGLDEFRP